MPLTTPISCISSIRFAALATDYDGTLADQGFVDASTIDGLRRLRRSGRRAILVTGRTLASMRDVFPDLKEFDSIVAENGATLYTPATNSETMLAAPPPETFLHLLRQRARTPFDVGRSIVATSIDEKQIVLDVIHELGLELHIIFNKGSLMVLPSGVNKATGLAAAAKALGISTHNMAGIGDAENDHAFLSACEFSAAVANALPTLKERVQFVTGETHGRGVVQLIDGIIANDLADHACRLGRPLAIGHTAGGTEVTVPACGNILLTGQSGGGKSTLTVSFLESLFSAGYQFCVIDAEGDYESFPDAVLLGNATHAPSVAEVLKALSPPTQNVVINLLGLELEQRPSFFQTLIARIEELRSSCGHPHCLIVDEAHHFISPDHAPPDLHLHEYADDPAAGLTLITVNPSSIPPETLARVRFLAIAGDEPFAALQAFCAGTGVACPDISALRLQPGEMLGWRPGEGAPFAFSAAPSESVRVRHRRKYAEGQLAPDRSFYFRGPQDKLNLRAPNLITFLNLMNGVDSETWLHHLRQGDYSTWFRKEIKDEDLARQAAEIENEPGLSADESRQKMHALITERYTIPA
ncbi:MAG TPA: HAD hydrolase family protein [Bryobacteraceae bacterium]|nr:HAD hydrolase family protein [Bryobacteraceae bacterium]